jgi:hypothetical protein
MTPWPLHDLSPAPDTWNVGRANPHPGVHVYTTWLPVQATYETLVVGPDALLERLGLPSYDSQAYGDNREAAMDGHRYWLGRVETWLLDGGEW